MRISDWSSDVCSSDLRDRVGFAIIAVAFRHLQSCEIGQYRVGTEASRDPGQKSRAPARDSDRFRMPRGGEAGRPETGMPRLCLGKPLEDAPNRRVALGPGERTEEMRSEEHTSELQSLMRISSAVFCLTKKTKSKTNT